MFNRIMRLRALVAPMLLAAPAAHASCGSAFCTLNTNVDALGAPVRPGFRVDLRGEYVDQRTLRSGTKKVEPAGEPDEHDEIRTLNRNLLAAFDYSWNEKWGVAVQAPLVDRFHEHVHNDPVDGPELEQWKFRKLGDIQVVGHYQFSGLPESNYAAGIQFGLKLPTGVTNIKNEDGERAERTLQPGTGTTDVVLGAYYNAPLDLTNRSSWFVQATVDSALNSDEDFKPGLHITVNTGVNYALNNRVSGLLQLNLSHKGRDSGAQAEPGDSGSRQAFLSPGLSVAIGSTGRLYGFVQIPVYQDVNGTQLTADRAYVFGWSQVF